MDKTSKTLFLYAYLLEDFTLENIIRGKISFERHAAQYRVKIKHNCRDNSIFEDLGIKRGCEMSRYILTYVELMIIIKSLRLVS